MGLYTLPLLKQAAITKQLNNIMPAAAANRGIM